MLLQTRLHPKKNLSLKKPRKRLSEEQKSSKRRWVNRATAKAKRRR